MEIRRNLLKQNDLAARALRTRFEENGVFVVSLVSSPGAGKTTLLEKLLVELKRDCRVAVVTGDLATENDCRRLAATGVMSRQITTGTVCHLDASMVEQSIVGWDLAALDFLFIENVGNLVCPAAYDLGEAMRLVLFSVTEGEDKPLKYPTIFNTADACIVSKIDLAQAVEFDERSALANLQAVRPGIRIFQLSARTGEGMQSLLQALQTAKARVIRPSAIS
ncbi:MAG TPA: hydrogenase nickel incorporation protein HypB [Terriglobales bacterium]